MPLATIISAGGFFPATIASILIVEYERSSRGTRTGSVGAPELLTTNGDRF